MSLQNDIEARVADLTPKTKSELMSYYQKEYPRSWNQKLSEGLQPFLPLSKKGEPQSIKNIERRHQSRGGKGIPGTTAATASQYSALSASLGNVPPAGGYIATFKGEILISGNPSNRENWTYVESPPLLIDGEAAKELARTGDPAIILTAYFQGQNLASDWQDATVTLEATGGRTGGPFKTKPQASRYEDVFRR